MVDFLSEFDFGQINLDLFSLYFEIRGNYCVFEKYGMEVFDGVCLFEQGIVFSLVGLIWFGRQDLREVGILWLLFFNLVDVFV